MLAPNFVSLAVTVFLVCVSDAIAAPGASAANTVAEISAASAIVADAGTATTIVADIAVPSSVAAVNGTLASVFGINIGVNSRDIVAWVSNDYHSQCYDVVALGPVRVTHTYG